MNDEQAGGRIFFSSTGRSLVEEDEIVVLSVGVDKMQRNFEPLKQQSMIGKRERSSTTRRK